MAKRTGHTRGGSHWKKKWDRVKKRNFYARDLLDPSGPYRTRIVQTEVKDKVSKSEILKELHSEED